MITNNQIRFVKSLQQKKYRKENALFVVEGEKMVEELINEYWKIHSLYTCGLQIESKGDYEVSQINQSQMDRMSGLKNGSVALAVVHQKTSTDKGFDGVSVVLDNITDPGNLGTIIRTCEWFGVKRIICSLQTVELYNSKVIQSSMGSLFRMSVAYQDLNATLSDFKNRKIPIYGTKMDGEDIRKEKFDANVVVVIGNESQGISQEAESFCSKSISIPSFDSRAESLNAAIALSVVLSCINLNSFN